MFGPFSASPWIMCDPATAGYWGGQSLEASTSIIEATNGAAFGFSRVQLVWDRTTPVGTREDVVVASLNFATPVGTAATPLGAGDKAVVEALLTTWWTTAKVHTYAGYTLREYRWYDYAPINSRPGPVVRVTAVGVVSTAVTRNADQLATTQTFKTASRKHWGRWYLPSAIMADIDVAYGRSSNAAVTAMEAATRTVFQVSGGSGIINPVVPSIQYNAILGVRELQQDNIIDVIRSRRAKVATFYARHTS